MKRRVVCVWLPHLAAERVMKSAPDQERPLAIVAEVKGALRLYSLNTAARQAGLIRDMVLADARAILPGLSTVPQDVERDEAFLRAIGRWAQRFTPSVALHSQVNSTEDLMLDTTGCAHLFGGEAKMLEELEAGLRRFGLTVQLGLADTRGGAWALSRFSGYDRIAPAGETRRVIEPMPVDALNLGAKACADLARIGLKTIRDVAALPRASIAKRFGVEVVSHIDRTLGIEADPLAILAQSAPHAVRISLPEPIATTDSVTEALTLLLQRLCMRLEREGLGARHLELSIRRADGGTDNVGIGLMRPGRDAVMISRLFEPKIDTLDVGFGIDAIRLQATQVEPLDAVQLAPEGEAKGEAIDTLLGRIANKIGFETVIRLAPAESHIPERSWLRFSAVHSNAVPEWPRPRAPRPITMVGPEALTVDVSEARRPPARMGWRGCNFETVHAIGPERITPEWWLDDPAWRTGLRDYWRIETACARRLWVYHTPEVPPETSSLSLWYVHGVFA